MLVAGGEPTSQPAPIVIPEFSLGQYGCTGTPSAFTRKSAACRTTSSGVPAGCAGGFCGQQVSWQKAYGAHANSVAITNAFEVRILVPMITALASPHCGWIALGI